MPITVQKQRGYTPPKVSRAMRGMKVTTSARKRLRIKGVPPRSAIRVPTTTLLTLAAAKGTATVSNHRSWVESTPAWQLRRRTRRHTLNAADHRLEPQRL